MKNASIEQIVGHLRTVDLQYQMRKKKNFELKTKMLIKKWQILKTNSLLKP